MQDSQNLPLPHRIYPPFLTTVCDPPRIDPSLPEYTPFFNNYMQHSQNLPLHPRIPASFSTTICDPSRIYSYISEYTSKPPPPHVNNYIYATNLESTPLSKNIPPLSLEIMRFGMLFFFIFKLRTTIGSTYACDPNPPFKKAGDGPDQGI